MAQTPVLIMTPIGVAILSWKTSLGITMDHPQGLMEFHLTGRHVRLNDNLQASAWRAGEDG